MYLIIRHINLILFMSLLVGCSATRFERQSWATVSKEQAEAECYHSINTAAGWGSNFHLCMESKGYKEVYVRESASQGMTSNVRSGYGTLTFPNGAKYVGEYKDNRPHGQGVRTFPDGQKQVGEFRDGKLNGQAIITFASGRKYVGECADDKRHGQGTLYDSNGSTVQSGTWANDALVGSR